MANSPTIRQAEARLGEARGRAVQAGLYPNPRVVPWDPHNLGQKGTVGKFNVFVQQSIVTGGKLKIERSRAEVEVLQAGWLARAQQHRVLNGLRVRYDRVLAGRREVELRATLAALADELVGLVARKVDDGKARRPDLLSARVAARQRHLDRDRAQGKLDAAWQDLAAFLGCPGMPPAPLVDDLERAGPPFDRDASVEPCCARAPSCASPSWPSAARSWASTAPRSSRSPTSTSAAASRPTRSTTRSTATSASTSRCRSGTGTRATSSPPGTSWTTAGRNSSGSRGSSGAPGRGVRPPAVGPGRRQRVSRR